MQEIIQLQLGGAEWIKPLKIEFLDDKETGLFVLRLV